jgi:ABC-type ATPase with predicted acetyltransferase domain
MSSKRLRLLAQWFCVPIRSARKQPIVEAKIVRQICRLVRPGRVILISGPSGSGKSLLLRRVRAHLARRTLIAMDAVELADAPLVDCFANRNLSDALSILSRVGLAEAWSYFRKPRQLSEGQRWRAKLALCAEQAKTAEKPVLLADEFCAVLDRLTAAIVARSLRRMIDSHPTLCAIVATSHDDLIRALQPDVIVRCDFGKITFVARTP